MRQIEDVEIIEAGVHPASHHASRRVRIEGYVYPCAKTSWSGMEMAEPQGDAIKAAYLSVCRDAGLLPGGTVGGPSYCRVWQMPLPVMQRCTRCKMWGKYALKCPCDTSETAGTSAGRDSWQNRQNRGWDNDD